MPCCLTCNRISATPPALTFTAKPPTMRSITPASSGRQLDRCDARGNHLHRRRHGSEQPCDQRGRLRAHGRLLCSLVPRRRTSLPAPSSIPPPCSHSSSPEARLQKSPTSASIAMAPSDPLAVEKTIGGNTALVSIMHANNEVGTLQPIREIAKIARSRGILVHTDAAQSIGKSALRRCQRARRGPPQHRGAQTVCAQRRRRSLHPQGGAVGAVHPRRPGTRQAVRAGTENVPYVVGLGKACEIARQSLPSASVRLAACRGDRLFDRLQQALGDRILERASETAAAQYAQRQFPRSNRAPTFCKRCQRSRASTGSACHEGLVTQSPVLWRGWGCRRKSARATRCA